MEGWTGREAEKGEFAVCDGICDSESYVWCCDGVWNLWDGGVGNWEEGLVGEGMSVFVRIGGFRGQASSRLIIVLC